MGEWDGEAPGGTPLDLVRQGTMSSDKELLRQLRDAMNPRQKQQTQLMLIQSGVGLVGLGILVGIVIVAQISLTSVETSVVGMSTALLPVQQMEEMSQTLDEMNDEL